MITEVGLFSHLVACLGFGLLAAALLWRPHPTREGLGLTLACLATAFWAGILVLAARFGGSYIAWVSPAETLRSAAWIGFLVAMLARSWRLQQRVSSSLIIAVVLGFIVAAQLGVDLAVEAGVVLLPPRADPVVAYMFLLARLTAAIGGLVLVHNLYVNAAPASRWSIRLLCIGLAGLFGYDLNMYTLNLLTGRLSEDLFNGRGIVDALIVPVIALSVRRNRRMRFQMSRTAAFHTLSLGAVGVYLILMSLAAYALRLVGGDWGRLLQIAFIFGGLVLAAVVIFSGRFRASARVWINKHFFAYKYDYRDEWLRFIGTMSRTDSAYGSLAERAVQAVCDIVDSPGGALYMPGEDGAYELAVRWNYRHVTPGRVEQGTALARYLGERGRIVDLDELREGRGDYGDVSLPDFALNDRDAWLIVPMLHREQLSGFVVVQRSLADRDLNWEDYDLLRTVGRQAASYIAEQSSQAALAEAQKFDEFNRRFAFIMHDIKNLVSQLSLVARNAERHADNPAFRADMVATLQSSVGKMNDLLARLSQHSRAKAEAEDTVRLDLAVLLGGVVAAKKAAHAALSLAAPDRPIMVSADPTRLEQVFLHLVQNAIDASAPGSPITVALSCDGSAARVTIEDAGAGMSAEFMRNELFKPFRSTKIGGFGIGAYEAREIVRSLGGRLDVASREGEGTLFTVVLPLAAAEQPKERKRA